MSCRDAFNDFSFLSGRSNPVTSVADLRYVESIVVVLVLDLVSNLIMNLDLDLVSDLELIMLLLIL